MPKKKKKAIRHLFSLREILLQPLYLFGLHGCSTQRSNYMRTCECARERRGNSDSRATPPSPPPPVKLVVQSACQPSCAKKHMVALLLASSVMPARMSCASWLHFLLMLDFLPSPRHFPCTLPRLRLERKAAGQGPCGEKKVGVEEVVGLICYTRA